MKRKLNYTISAIPDDAIGKMKHEILKSLMDHTDRCMNEFIEKETKKHAEIRKGQLIHMRVVEGYLFSFNKLIKKILKHERI